MKRFTEKRFEGGAEYSQSFWKTVLKSEDSDSIPGKIGGRSLRQCIVLVYEPSKDLGTRLVSN